MIMMMTMSTSITTAMPTTTAATADGDTAAVFII
jgi:hypothetical protein